MAILSIQSTVTYGHVGNAAAVPALRVLGHEVWPISTVTLSNHPGHGRFTGRTRSAAELTDLFSGLRGLGVLARCDAVLSGYLGRPSTAGVVAGAVRAVRRANRDAIYVLDPVIGDDGRIYVAPGVVDEIRRRLLPLADIITPNLFELGWLTDRPADGADAMSTDAMSADVIEAAARELCRRGTGQVVVTGVLRGERIAACVVTAHAVRWATAPYRRVRFRGAGDLFAALYTAHFLATGDIARALDAAMSGLDLVTERTVALGGDELALGRCLAGLAAMRGG